MKDWIPVSKENRCPVCDRPDWCLIGLKFILCNRIQSDKPQKGGGWLHPVTFEYSKVNIPKSSKQAENPTIDAARLISEWQADTKEWQLIDVAGHLAVSETSLSALGACWAARHHAWAFPMANGQGEIIGIRLRNDDGEKWAVKGSRAGIFLPSVDPQKTAYVCEGPTDTAAALTLGFYAIGRPSCNSGGLDLKTACNRLGVRQVVIVADNDDPGQQGANRIAGELGLRTCIFTPPAKDLREFVRLGGTRLLIEQQVNNTVWRK